MLYTISIKSPFYFAINLLTSVPNFIIFERSVYNYYERGSLCYHSLTEMKQNNEKVNAQKYKELEYTALESVSARHIIHTHIISPEA